MGKAVRGLLPQHSLCPVLLFQGYHRSNHFIATQGTRPLSLWQPLKICLPASPSVCLSIPTACLRLLYLTAACIPCLFVPPEMTSPPRHPGCVYPCRDACARAGQAHPPRYGACLLVRLVTWVPSSLVSLFFATASLSTPPGGLPNFYLFFCLEPLHKKH